MLLIEQLLMMTGLHPPVPQQGNGSYITWNQAMTGAEGLLVEMRADMLAALERETPGRHLVVPMRENYYKRLQIQPPYDLWHKRIEARMGTQAADEWQALHTNARRVLLDRRPKMEIATVMGPREMPLDSISEGRWRIAISVVEDNRILKDLAAGAVLKDEVEVFQSCFPETYDYLMSELDTELPKRFPAGTDKLPPAWISPSLLVFEGQPLGTSLELTPSKENPKPVAKAGNTSKSRRDIIDGLKTATQGVK